ncbi:MAG: DUF2878 domain-containing protein [Candidatus Neomarinimicrobiota bacterium]
MKKIFNILGFKISWWACVLGAAGDMTYIGPIAMLVFLIIHFYLNSLDFSEIKLIAIFALFGTLIDTSMAYTGMLSYNGVYGEDIIIAPLWITAMWCGFASMVNHSMAFLKGKWIYAFILGGLLGPVAYKAGEGLGAINFITDQLSIIIMLSFVWALSFPFIYWVNERLGLGIR